MSGIIEKMPGGIRQFFTFCVVGGVNTVFSLAVIIGLSVWGGLHYTLANVLGYAAGLAVGFILHKTITFRGDAAAQKIHKQFSKFLGVFFVSYAVQFLVLIALVQFGGIWDVLAQILAWSVFVIISFAGNRFVTFRRAR